MQCSKNLEEQDKNRILYCIITNLNQNIFIKYTPLFNGEPQLHFVHFKCSELGVLECRKKNPTTLMFILHTKAAIQYLSATDT